MKSKTNITRKAGIFAAASKGSVRRASYRPSLERLENRETPTVNILNSFAGMAFPDTQAFTPPDTTGAAGPSQYLEAVNSTLRLFDKATGATLATIHQNAFFSAPAVGSVFDPVVTYDELANRFVIATLQRDTIAQASFMYVAVSNNATPTDFSAANWTERHQLNVGVNIGGVNYWGDYPKIGWNADAYVITLNMFSFANAYRHSRLITLDKPSYTDNNAATRTEFIVDRAAGADFTMAAANMHGGTAGGPIYLVETESFSSVRVLRMSNVLSSTPTFVETVVNVNSFTNTTNATQGGGVITTNDVRMLNAEWRGNRLVSTHAVGQPGAPARARWYEFDTTGTPSLLQQGEIAPVISGAGSATFMPSIAIAANGDIGMTFMESSANEFISMYVTGRNPGDAPGTMQTPVVVQAGARQYADFVGSPYRSGDYSGINVDPVTGTTFWAANEYATNAASNNWGTYIGNFQVVPPIPPALTIVQTGGSTTVTEGGATDTYTVALATAPSASVTVNLNVLGAQVTLSATTLAFTTTNWNTPQPVIVTAVDDTTIEGTHSAIIRHVSTSADTSYNNLTASLTVSITDNDTGPGIRISETNGYTEVTEGGSNDTYLVQLNTQPTANVSVTLSFGNQIVASPTSLTFTPSNWNVPRTITVSAVDDTVVESVQIVAINHVAGSTDSLYGGKTAVVNVIVNDDDRLEGVVIIETNGSTAVTEGGSGDTYSVVLRTAPSANVTVTVTPPVGQATVAPATLTFTPANWFLPQTVIVTAVQDAILEGLHVVLVTHTAASTDPGYNGIGVDDVRVIITDDDTPSPILITRPLRWTYNRARDYYQGDITIRNFSNRVGAGPLYLVIRNLPSTVSIVNAVSFTANGSPYIPLPSGNLPANSTVRIPVQVRKPLDYPLGTYDFGFVIDLTGNLNDLSLATQSGYVYVDANKNGVREFGEAGIPNVYIQLTGTTFDGQRVNDLTFTDSNGYYRFYVLPGNYTVTQIQPAGYRDGLETLGSLGGLLSNNSLGNIGVQTGDNGSDYNFGEWINHAPTLTAPNASSTAGAGTLSFDLSASDSDGDALTYTAKLAGNEGHAAQAFKWKQELGLTFNGNYMINRLRYGFYEKWLPGAGRKLYFILPDGRFYLYSGRRGLPETHTLLGQLSPDYYYDPSLIWDATEPAAQVSVIGQRVYVTARAGFAGVLEIEASANDGLTSDTKTLTVTLANQPTQLTAIADQSMHANRTLTLTPEVSDADGDRITIGGHLSDMSDIAWQLKQTYGFVTARRYRVNLLRLGYQEIWISGANRTTFLLRPDGRLYQYIGVRAPFSQQIFITKLDPMFYFNPNLLAAATEPVARITASGSQLMITPRAGYTGAFTVTAYATDGVTRDTKSFQVTVSNEGPRLEDLSDLTITGGTTRITLPGSDPDGDALTYEAFLVEGTGLAYELKQSLGLRPSTNYMMNRLRFDHQELWLRGAGNKFYLLTPDGNLYLWNRRYEPLTWQTPIAKLGAEYYYNLDSLWFANTPTIDVRIDGNQLFITPKIGYTGTFTVSVRVSDGIISATKSFKVTVN